jgi:hypothetical protein
MFVPELDERPVLAGFSFLERIVLHIKNGALHVGHIIKKNVPPSFCLNRSLGRGPQFLLC